MLLWRISLVTLKNIAAKGLAVYGFQIMTTDTYTGGPACHKASALHRTT